MDPKEQQLQPMPQQKGRPSINQSTTHSIVVMTEPDEKKQLHRKQKKKITIGKIIKFLISVALVLGVVIYFWRKPVEIAQTVTTRTYEEGAVELNQTISKKFAWIRQKLDHFTPTDERTFYQRIFINNEGASSKTTPTVFLYIPDFQPVTYTQKSDMITKQVEERKGISLAIQMRYFGESQPFKDDSYSLQNLKYLAVQQMIQDVSYAIQRIIDNRFFGISQRNQWVINGARLSGTIAAWIRGKYPTLSVGAIASGPLLPTTLAPLINERLYAKVGSGGKKCKVALDKIRQNIEEELADDRKEPLVYSIGEGVELTTDEVLYFYQQRIDNLPREFFIFICYPSTQSTILQAMRQIMFSKQMHKFDALSFSQRAMASPEDWRYFEVVRTARANWYLRCTQTGLFQVFPTTSKSFSSPSLNETFFRNRCKYIFGKDLWPDPNPLLSEYQPYLTTATNLLVMHGFYDTKLPYGLNVSSARTHTITKQCLRCEGLFDYDNYHSNYEAIEDALAQERSVLDRWIRGKK